MSKFVNGLVKFSVATAAICGICYLFKDKIKESQLYNDYEVDDKIKKVKETIKDKMPWGADEEEIIEDDEIFLDVAPGTSTDRDYVTLDAEDLYSSEDEPIPTI